MQQQRGQSNAQTLFGMHQIPSDNRSLWFAAIAMTVQIIYDGWKRGKATSKERH
ncbi:MAG: hypothetical protein JF606_27410 [Burkholderiales bacterium]|nr:hypothetical protein [Burkholderiales bacterium]